MAMRRVRGCLLRLLLLLGLLVAAAWWLAAPATIAVANLMLPISATRAATVIERASMSPSATPAITVHIQRDLLRQLVTSLDSHAPQWPWRWNVALPENCIEGTFAGLAWRVQIADSAAATPAWIVGTPAWPGPALHGIGPELFTGAGTPTRAALRFDSLRVVNAGPARWRLIGSGMVGLGDGLTVAIKRCDAQVIYSWFAVPEGYRPRLVVRVETLDLRLPNAASLRDWCEREAQKELDKISEQVLISGPPPRAIPIDIRMGAPLSPEDP